MTNHTESMEEIVELNDGTLVRVDAQDAALVRKFAWRMNSNGYVCRSKTNPGKYFTMELLHREIMNSPKGMSVDHRNGDRLDMRRENLRVCPMGLNSKNLHKTKRPTSSKYKGVTLSNGKWQVAIRNENKRHYIGRFDSEDQAGHEYNKAAVRLHGEFACLNPVGV